MNISKKMKAPRLELGLTCKEVALYLKVAESTYRDWLILNETQII